MQVVSMAIVSASFFIIAIVSLVLAVLSHWWPLLIYANSFILLVMLYLQIADIPLSLNWSRNLYGYLLKRLFGYILFTAGVYALHFRSGGLLRGAEPTTSIRDALYFSFTTWTTLGYGDMGTVPSMRLATSLEALTGILTAAVLTSMIWLYCQERLHDTSKENVGNLVIQYDRTVGGYRDAESPEIEAERAKRRAKFRLNPCASCGQVPELEKYYDITGRLVPLANFIAVCKCGRFKKPSKNAYWAAYRWNRSNHA